MGFYGSVTNTSKTNLQFDRKYPNRFQMEASCLSDGVYAGRYVLIEYDLKWDNTNLTNSQFVMLYDNGGVFSTSPDGSVPFTPTLDVIYRAVELESWVINPEGKDLSNYYTNKYYIGVLNENSNTVELKLASNSDSAYVTNFNIDTNYYGEGRGWDSTAWVKHYDSDGKPEYIQVAELNSVVPTFAISVDAPTEIPQSPHFDENNTNIFYTIHLQPQWGMQVKEAKPDAEVESETFSDITQPKRTYNTYNESNVIIDTEVKTDVPLNIYYNADGFNSQKKSFSNLTDNITLDATGKSGKYYNNSSHEIGAPKNQEIDTYEFSLLLPSLGNAVSNMWDIVYDVDEANIRKRDIAWKDAFSNTEDELLGGMSTSLNTLAGTINAVHNLMGMIITDENRIEDISANNYIFTNGLKYYRVINAPIMKQVEGEITDFNQKYYVYNSQLNKYEPANPNVANRIYYYIEDYEKQYLEMPGFEENVSTLYGLLLKMANALDLNNENSLDTNTVQGCINQLNSIVNIFSDLKPSEFVIVNENGQVISSSWTTRQALEYNNALNNNVIEVDTKENQWITVDVNPTARLISIFHSLANNISNTATSTNYDDNNEIKDEFTLYSPYVDNAGHVIGHNLETITLPKGVKFINTNGVSNSEADLEAVGTTSYTAENIKDTFNINTGNKWLETKIEDKNLTLAHSVFTISDEDETNNLNDSDVSTFKVQDIEYDNAGHIVSNLTHTYTLPYSFKYLSTTGNADDRADSFSSLPGETSVKAQKVYSKLNINPKNKWIQIRLENDESDAIMSIAHLASGKNDTTVNTNISNNENKISATKFNYDEAGHVLSTTTTNYTLPNNFSQFTVNGSSVNPTTAFDTLTLQSDSWINVNGTSKTISYTHNNPVSEAHTINPSSDNTLSLKFNDKFKVPTFSYDEKGHIYSASTHELTLPSLLREDYGNGNVLIGSSIDSDDNGKLRFEKAYVGSLAITEYSGVEDYTSLSATDTLNTALGKLEAGYISNRQDLNTLMGSDDGSVNKMIDNAIETVTGGDIATIKELNEKKVDNDKIYNIISSIDSTIKLEGTIEDILQQILDRTVTPPSVDEGSETV